MSRKGSAWTDKEDKYLTEAVERGDTYAVINERCKRTIEELKARVTELKSTFEPDTPTNASAFVDTASMEEDDKPVIPAKPAAIAKPAARRMTSWTAEEDDQLIKELKEGKTFEQVAELHGRTLKAISMRMTAKVTKMSNKTIPEISEITGLSAKQVGVMLGKAIDSAASVMQGATMPVPDIQVKLLTEMRDLLIQIRDSLQQK